MPAPLHEQAIGIYVNPGYWDGAVFNADGPLPEPDPEKVHTMRAAHAAGAAIVEHVASGRPAVEGQALAEGEIFDPKEFKDGTVIELQIEALYTTQSIDLGIDPANFANLRIPKRPDFGTRRDLVSKGQILHYVTGPWHGAVIRTGIRRTPVVYVTETSSITRVKGGYDWTGGVNASTQPFVVGQVEAVPTYMHRATSLQFYLPDRRKRVTRGA